MDGLKKPILCLSGIFLPVLLISSPWQIEESEPVVRWQPSIVNSVVKSYLQVKISDAAELEILDILGRKMWEGKINRQGEYRVDVRGFPSGTYILRLLSPVRTEEHRFIVVH